MKKVIKAYKYRFVRELSEPLANLLVSFLENRFPKADLVSFVPLTKQKLNTRGFNQAQVLAELLRGKYSLEVRSVLEKKRETINQADLKPKERRKNLRGIFRCREDLPGKRVLLVDDVSTTGTTLNECSKVLKKAGAARVYGVVLARGN